MSGHIRVAPGIVTQIDEGQLLLLADPSYVPPMLGADRVAQGERPTMLAFDLSSTFPTQPGQAALDAFVGSALGPPPVLPGEGGLPGRYAALFSPHARSTRVGAADRENAAAAFRAYPEAGVPLVRETEPQPGVVQTILTGQAACAAAYRRDDKGLGLLARTFGKAWADRSLNEVLSPSRLSAVDLCLR